MKIKQLTAFADHRAAADYLKLRGGLFMENVYHHCSCGEKPALQTTVGTETIKVLICAHCAKIQDNGI